MDPPTNIGLGLGPVARIRADSSESQATTPEPQFFRHRWLKPLVGGRNTSEIVGTQAADSDSDDSDEGEEENDDVPDSESRDVDFEPSSAKVKEEVDGPTDGSSSPNEGGKPHPGTRGKKLIPWHRDRMAEKLLLCIQYECYQSGISIPYEDAIQRLQVSPTLYLFSFSF